MKHVLIALAFLTSVGAKSVFATDVTVTRAVLQSFHMQFRDVSTAVWTEVDGRYRAEFTEEGQKNYAYYSPTGELIVVSKQISFDKLPKSLQEDWQERFGKYAITDVYEFTTEDVTDYYLFLENDKKQITLRSQGKRWNQFQAHKK